MTAAYCYEGIPLRFLASLFDIHSKKRTTCSDLMKTALNNVLLPTLFKVVNNIVQHCYT